MVSCAARFSKIAPPALCENFRVMPRWTYAQAETERERKKEKDGEAREVRCFRSFREREGEEVKSSEDAT